MLRGAVETLRRHRPVVAFEYGRGSADVYGTPPAPSTTCSAPSSATRYTGWTGDGPYGRERFEQIFASGERVNFAARPRA
jgi:hypothetical protein